MVGIETWRGRSALIIAFVAGMIDLVSLPVWVGNLIQRYQFSPPQAGGLVTLFLVGAVCASLFFAPRFTRLQGRTAAILGFGVAALCFYTVSRFSDYRVMAVLHLAAGVAAGSGLSFALGTIGRSLNPHRLFAFANIGLGVFGTFFLGTVPHVLARFGGPALFLVFATLFLVACFAAVAGFPAVPRGDGEAAVSRRPRFDATSWWAIAGVVLLVLNQAMIFSFVEQIGVDHGFSRERIDGVLVTLGLVNITPAIFAALLQKRLPATTVALAGPVVQAALAVAISSSTTFWPYAVPTVFFAFVMIFTHTFVFGFIAKVEPTGRALASTPAMLMTGSAIAPLIGGILVQQLGYPALGAAACGFAAIAVLCFNQARRRAPVFAV
jgi:predicted MFS family arabinose efflux permease